MGLLDALPVELRRSIAFATIQTTESDSSVVGQHKAWRRTLRTLHRLEATSKAWKELVSDSAVWFCMCNFCWPQQTRMLADAAVIESHRQFCKQKLTVFQLPPTEPFGMTDLWWTVDVSCYDPGAPGGDERERHLAEQTAHFKLLPDDGWLTIVLDEPVTMMSLADIELDENRWVQNCWVRICWSAFRRTDQKMVELLDDTPQWNCEIEIPEDTTSDADTFISVITSPAQDHNVDTYQPGGNDTIEIHADHGFTYRLAGPPEARVLQLVSLSLSYYVGWDESHPRARFRGQSKEHPRAQAGAEHEFMRFLDYQGWQ